LAAAGSIRDEIVRTIEGQVGFVVHAWRRVADHLFAWINRDHGDHHIDASVPLGGSFDHRAAQASTLTKRSEIVARLRALKQRYQTGIKNRPKN